MADIDKYNGDLPPAAAAAQVQVTDINDKVAALAQCETFGYDPGLKNEKGSKEDNQNHSEDNSHCATTPSERDAHMEEVILEDNAMPEKEINDLSQAINPKEQAFGEDNMSGSEVEQLPSCELHKLKDFPKDQVKDQAGAERLSSNLSEILTEHTEEETPVPEALEDNTTIGSDKDNEEPLFEEEENGPKDSLSLSPSDSQLDTFEEQPLVGNRPDISRHSYSRYDTVSYRKIRKGNTKQRIDEFESMMNV